MEVGVAPARFRLTRRRFSLQCLASLMMAGPSLPSPAAQVHRGSASRRSAFQRARLLRRGINLGNMLDAPEEGAWGVRLKAEYFYVIARAGFGSVRIPIRWSAHAEVTPPYRIDPAFLRRVDWAIRQALSRGLVAVIDVHHYAEMNLDPPGHLPRLTSLWTQIAEHYRNWPNGLFFELLNEPEGKLTDERWSEIVPHLLRAVRESNARRMVVVGPAHQYAATSLDRLNLPENDPYLIASFHYYSPLRFTHQGADWVAGSEAWRGTSWEGSPEERRALTADFDRVAAWAARSNRPVYLSEFGAYQAADMDSRRRWTAAVAAEAARLGFVTAYWEFCSSFGAYDPQAGAWRQPLLRALMSTKPLLTSPRMLPRSA